tara:strand:+ start:4917 stop:5471 length:555 start_codon:yes stop_codon:yes gene_type:complete
MLGWMTLGVSYNSKDIVLSQAKQSNKMDVSQIISYDFPKIGYSGDIDIDSLIVTAKSNKIAFFSNIDNSADNSIEKIIWEFTNREVTSTANPNDFILARTIDGVETEITLGVTEFRINYYDELGSQVPLSFPLSVADINSIRQIEVELVIESADQLKLRSSSPENYVRTAWIKRFTPRNLPTNL